MTENIQKEPANDVQQDDMKWTVLESEYLFRRPWLTARRDKVRLPNGNINPEFYVLEYPDWVNVIAITDGVCEKGETPEQAARRELLEETGYGDGEWTLSLVSAPNASTSNNHCYSFVATGVRKITGQHLEATEDISVHLKTREEVLELMLSGQIRQATMLSPLWKYFAEHF